jgi:hypothetical protein
MASPTKAVTPAAVHALTRTAARRTLREMLLLAGIQRQDAEALVALANRLSDGSIAQEALATERAADATSRAALGIIVRLAEVASGDDE